MVRVLGSNNSTSKRKARHQIGLIHFGNVPEVATNNIVAADVAAEGGNGAILAGGT